ncbi:MFS transporter [Nocardioides sambongensis]|uniref:MFS transporter n=1 Tax=Nocardioides sambongensis TaxID=2589074 RepID=UPI0015E86B56|nr:MFS transporter [Nocardioides sambongensis]
MLAVVLVGAAFLAGVDLFIVNVAFDQIGADFAGADLSALSWILSAYAVVYAAMLVPMGRLADRFGQKRGFVAGMSVFVVASLLCGLAPGVWWLVAFRAVQAVGAAAMTPASLGLLLAAVAPERRAPAARMWALTGAVAAALGPAVGGFLVQISWHWAFWINLPIGALLILGAVRLVPDVRPDADTPLPDLLGAVVLAVAVGALMLGLVQGAKWGWGSLEVLGCFATALMALGLFARRTTRHRSPVISPALLTVPDFRWANIATLAFNIGFGAALLGAILWLQREWEYGALQTGLAVALGPLAVPVTSILAHRVLPNVRPGSMIAAGSLVFAGAVLWQSWTLGPTPAYLTDFLPAWVLAGVGVGLAMPNLVAAATAGLPPDQTSTGAGVVNMARQVGLAFGVSILVTLIDSHATTSQIAFDRAWYTVAAAMIIAAAAGLRIQRREPALPADAPTPSVTSP